VTDQAHKTVLKLCFNTKYGLNKQVKGPNEFVEMIAGNFGNWDFPFWIVMRHVFRDGCWQFVEYFFRIVAALVNGGPCNSFYC